MPVIRMLFDMQGSRHDNQQWPGYYGLIDVPQWEADQLINAGNAEYPDKPKLDRGYDVLKVRETTDVDSQLKLADGSDQDVAEDEDEERTLDPADDDWDDDDFDRDEDEDFEREGSSIAPVPTDADQPVTDQSNNFSPPPGPNAGTVKRPSQTDNKDAWIEWAVYNGVDRDVAQEMTKTQLVARFKAR